MLPVSISSYECPICGKLSRSKKDIEKCILADQEAERENMLEAQKRKKEQDFADYIRLNLEDLKDLPKMLEEHASKINIILTPKISNPRFEMSRQWSGLSEQAVIKSKPMLGFTLSGAIDTTNYKKQSNLHFGIFDFINYFCSGIEVVGGNGGNHFDFQLKLDVNKFPKLSERFNFVKANNESYQSFLKKLRSLGEEYNEYLTLKCIADPMWAVVNQEIKELRLEQAKIAKKIESKEKYLINRRVELDTEREERTHADPEIDLDIFDSIRKSLYISDHILLHDLK